MKAALDPAKDPDSFGCIAIELKYISEDDLLEAVHRQEQRLPLGEILVGMGKITPWQRDQVLLEQEARRAPTQEARVAIAFRRQSLMITSMKTYLSDVHTLAAEFTATMNRSIASESTSGHVKK